MSDNNAQDGVEKEYFEEVGLLLGVQGQIKKSVNNDIGAPAAYLAKPIFRQCFIHTVPKIKIISVNIQSSFDQWSITRLIGGKTLLNKFKILNFQIAKLVMCELGSS